MELIVDLPAKPAAVADAMIHFYNNLPPKMEQYRNGLKLKLTVRWKEVVLRLIRGNIAECTSDSHRAALKVCPALV